MRVGWLPVLVHRAVTWLLPIPVGVAPTCGGGAALGLAGGAAVRLLLGTRAAASRPGAGGVVAQAAGGVDDQGQP
jgi:hypothetical protein